MRWVSHNETVVKRMNQTNRVGDEDGSGGKAILDSMVMKGLTVLLISWSCCER